MKLFRRVSLLVVAVLCELFLPASAIADTYQLIVLENDAVWRPYAIGSSGDVVLMANSAFADLCTPSNLSYDGPCFVTFVNGVEISRSTTVPVLDTTEGPPGPGCTAPPSGVLVLFSGCVNGHEILELLAGPLPAFYSGPDLANDLIVSDESPSSSIFVDSYGDFVFDSERLDDDVEFFDLTTHAEVPEPSGFILLGTGALMIGHFIRRRISAVVGS